MFFVVVVVLVLETHPQLSQPQVHAHRGQRGRAVRIVRTLLHGQLQQRHYILAARDRTKRVGSHCERDHRALVDPVQGLALRLLDRDQRLSAQEAVCVQRLTASSSQCRSGRRQCSNWCRFIHSGSVAKRIQG